MPKTRTKKIKRKSWKDMQDIVECEGLGYAVAHYIGHTEVPAEIEDAWRRAKVALDEIEAALEERAV